MSLRPPFTVQNGNAVIQAVACVDKNEQAFAYPAKE